MIVERRKLFFFSFLSALIVQALLSHLYTVLHTKYKHNHAELR